MTIEEPRGFDNRTLQRVLDRARETEGWQVTDEGVLICHHPDYGEQCPLTVSTSLPSHRFEEAATDAGYHMPTALLIASATEGILGAPNAAQATLLRMIRADLIHTAGLDEVAG